MSRAIESPYRPELRPAKADIQRFEANSTWWAVLQSQEQVMATDALVTDMA